MHLLERIGCRGEAVQSGLEALDALEHASYDVILMDVQMPEMDGLETTTRIRERERRNGDPRITIIAMTAHAMQGDRERCLAAGMDDYLGKPVKRQELEQKLAQWAGTLVRPADRKGEPPAAGASLV